MLASIRKVENYGFKLHEACDSCFSILYSVEVAIGIFPRSATTKGRRTPMREVAIYFHKTAKSYWQRPQYSQPSHILQGHLSRPSHIFQGHLSRPSHILQGSLFPPIHIWLDRFFRNVCQYLWHYGDDSNIHTGSSIRFCTRVLCSLHVAGVGVVFVHFRRLA